MGNKLTSTAVASLEKTKHNQASGSGEVSFSIPLPVQNDEKAADMALEEASGEIRKRNILLVGKSGQGKSALGNSILGSEHFQTSDATNEKAQDIVSHFNETDGLKITVYDALTVPDETDCAATIRERLNQCFEACPEGFHCIMFVFMYNVRATKEDRIASEILKELFSVEQQITVFTYGESFDLNNMESFDTWYKNVEDPMLKEVCQDSKPFLVYNSSKDKMVTQRQEILKAVRSCHHSVSRDKQRLVTNLCQDARPLENKSSSSTNMKTTSGHNDVGVTESRPGPVADVDSDLDFFLIGKTGHGKSATGNTILGRQKFKTSDMSQSATVDTDAGWVEKDGMIIKVVDGPGLLDTRLAGVKDLKQMESNVWKGFQNCPNGFHALLLVFRYGTRFTVEEKKTVRLLKGLLGDDFLKNHGILIFTNGDSFELNHKKKKFEDWCKEQKEHDEYFKELLHDCDNRVVLFYNRTREKRDESINRLIAHAHLLNKRYTSQVFDDIRIERYTFIQKEGAFQLRDLIQSRIDLIIGSLEREEMGKNFDQRLEELEREINKESSKQKVVDDLKRAIQHARNKKYVEALDEFRKIEFDGQERLMSLNHLILAILTDALRPLRHLLE